MRDEEKTYETLLSIDYELLCSLIENKKTIICFIDVATDIGTYRKMLTTKSLISFDGVYLAFMDEKNPSKEMYIEFCKRERLRFINPNI